MGDKLHSIIDTATRAILYYHVTDGYTSDITEEITKSFVTGKQNGMGLGLYIVQQVMEAHSWKWDSSATCRENTAKTIHLFDFSTIH